MQACCTIGFCGFSPKAAYIFRKQIEEADFVIVNRIDELAARSWKHPQTGEALRVSFKTIERWFYAARDQSDPLAALARKVHARADTHPSVSAALGEAITARELIAAGADVNAYSPDGLTALALASFFGRTQVVELLLAARADLPSSLASGMEGRRLPGIANF